jgi:cell division transport system ATP-binding protein
LLRVVIGYDRFMDALELNHIGLHYASGAEVLRDISFRCPQGSFYFLTGPSGAGKSSLLRICTLMERPSAGYLRIDGQDPAGMLRSDLPKLRRRIGVVFQDFRLLPHLTVAENVALPLVVAGAKPKIALDHVQELLTWSGVGDKTKAYPAELSGGQQQRVAIARAVINKPKLLLADEPTGNIDDVGAERVMHLFAELHKMGTTIILATHDQNLLEIYDYPCLHLHGGRIHQPKFTKERVA